MLGYQRKDQSERAELISFILQNSNLRDEKIDSVFSPPFDIIWKLAREALKYKPDQKRGSRETLCCPFFYVWMVLFGFLCQFPDDRERKKGEYPL
jgi:hypothetical protein